ncbi:AAA family ATPase [cyanobacterium endosymbiont of Rhopalodia gibberula]|uniref:AAA family ATPase n=1 Tax=cyanobacterium endosymbiont of Rhopalodia gibberula TaxID=1763363 RepID=UPI000E65722E|nr:AAA family ATPase [cyanobacterium endosymbiont of Rhopalodia gibberula]
MDCIEENKIINAVGGLEKLNKWLKQRSDMFTKRARKYSLSNPKRMLIFVVRWYGKFLIAKTIFLLWRSPLLYLDMGLVYDSLTIGHSETNLCNAFKTDESISPVIFFIDELDKPLFGGTGFADSNKGTFSRISGSFLT